MELRKGAGEGKAEVVSFIEYDYMLYLVNMLFNKIHQLVTLAYPCIRQREYARRPCRMDLEPFRMIVMLRRRNVIAGMNRA